MTAINTRLRLDRTMRRYRETLAEWARAIEPEQLIVPHDLFTEMLRVVLRESKGGDLESYDLLRRIEEWRRDLERTRKAGPLVGATAATDERATGRQPAHGSAQGPTRRAPR